MIYIYLTIGTLIGVIVLLLSFIIIMQYRHNQLLDDINTRSMEKHRLWRDERESLLDRIQAPSFDHLKQAEVRIIKANKEEPAIKYELV